MPKRKKTNTNVNVPLQDIPKMILKKYEGKLLNGKILPVISIRTARAIRLDFMPKSKRGKSKF